MNEPRHLVVIVRPITPAVGEERGIAPPLATSQDPTPERSPAVVERSPAVVERSPAVVERSPAVVVQAPAVVEQAPAVVERSPAVVERSPAVVEQSPAVVVQAPAVEQAETPSASEDAAVKSRTRAPVLGSPLRAGTLAAVVLSLLGLALALALGEARPAAVGLGAAANGVEAGRTHAWLVQLQRDHSSRVRGSFAHRDAPRFIATALKKAGASDVHQEFYEDAKLRNVIGRIPGKDSSQRVVLCAHHDVVPGAPGAIDDGGAVAVLLETARVLSSLPEPPERDVVIAIFDGEERGCLGAFAHLEAMGAEDRGKIRAALAVELVGWTEDQLVVHTIPYGFAWEAPGIAPAWIPESIRAAGEAVGVPVGLGDPLVSPWYQATIRAQKVLTGSDAGAYSDNGIPSAMLTGSALTNFYAGYHTSRDSMSLVSSASLDDAAKVCVATALEFSARKDASKTLGEPYLMFGLRSLHRPALTAIGLGAALALLFASVGFLRLGWTFVGGAMLTTALCTAALAVLADVLGLLIGVPLCLGLAVGACLQRGWLSTLTLIVARIPLYVQVLLVVAASLAFGGFAWRGGTLPTVLVVIASIAGILAGMQMSALRRRRARV